MPPTAVGSSGGVLCDGSGAVVGMTTAIGSPTDAAANALGYAIPIEIVRAVTDDIIASGSARHSWLGVEGADLDPANAKDIGITGGAKVTKVVDNSPAWLAGLQSEDVITARWSEGHVDVGVRRGPARSPSRRLDHASDHAGN